MGDGTEVFSFYIHIVQTGEPFPEYSVVDEVFPIHPIRVLIILQISGIEVYLGNEILYALIDRARPAKLSLVLK